MKMLKRRNDEFYLMFGVIAIVILLICFGFLNISYQLRKSSSNVNKVDSDSDSICEESSKKKCSSLIIRKMHHRTPKDFPLTASNDGKFVILILSSDSNENRILRSTKNVIKMAEEIPVFLHLQNSSINTAKFDSLPIHLVSSSNYFNNVVPYVSLSQKLFSNPLRSIFENANDQRLKECSILQYKDTINVFTPTRKEQKFFTYSFNEVDDEEQKLDTFGEFPFHPYKSKNKSTEDNKEYDGRLSQGNSEIAKKCELAKNTKNAIRFIIEKFPNVKFLIVIDNRKHFTPNIMSYFKEVSKAFDLESSLYCVSADNPLQREDSEPPEEELQAVDNFVFGGATLIPREILDEILSSYRIVPKRTVENTETRDLNNIMEDIGDWLSWWRVKKSRYCVVPAKPRVCDDAKNCSQNLTTNFDLQSLIRHRYFHNLFYSLEMVKPLLYESCPCQNETKPLLDANKNETSYALYVKMISQDDNLMLNYAMKCFGIDQRVGEGHFDNVYKFYWGKDPVFIIGVPYSNFGPSIKLESTLYMLQVTPEFGESLAGILKAQNYDAESANLTAVPFEFKNEDKNATEETSSTTAATTTTTIIPTSK